MRYLAEFYLPCQGADLESLASRAIAAAEQVSKTGPPVRFMTVIHAPEDENCFVIYEAAALAAVLAAGSFAGIAFDHIVSVTTLEA